MLIVTADDVKLLGHAHHKCDKASCKECATDDCSDLDWLFAKRQSDEESNATYNCSDESGKDRVKEQRLNVRVLHFDVGHDDNHSHSIADDDAGEHLHKILDIIRFEFFDENANNCAYANDGKSEIKGNVAQV